jgi:hypothetical protein
MRKFPVELKMYETTYGTDIPSEQLFLLYFDSVVSKETGKEYYNPFVFTHFTENGFEVECRNVRNRRHDTYNDNLLIHKGKEIMVKISSCSEKDPDLYQIEFFYNIKKGKRDEQFSFLDLKKYEKKKIKANISLVKSEMGHLETQDYDLPIPDIDLGLNYGKDFLKVHDVIIEKLNKPRGKGIILLHGEPGTGKTSYLKYITKLITDKDILFIPPSLAEALSEPSIIPFLMEHRDSILVIEDAERVISDREGNGSPAGVSNVLNITDGILGDCLNIQIIATFNMKRERIDQALLRKGRLIAEHKFEKLAIEDTNNLLKHLKKDIVSEEAMTLADIYNIDIELIKSTNKNTSKIGF